MLEPFKDDFEIRIDETILPHEENLKRIAECHIYVELFKPELNGKPYGCFGVTAFEATALGCVVLTNNLHESIYTNIYKNQPFCIANDKSTFQRFIKLFKSCTEILDVSTNFYNNHSIESTGKRILSLIK